MYAIRSYYGLERLHRLLIAAALVAALWGLRAGLPQGMGLHFLGRITSYNVCYTKLLRHVLRGLVGVVRNERAHAEALLGDPGGFVVGPRRKRVLDLRQREQMIAHVD